MFVLEKTYDPKELCRNNMHTHSVFSKCSKPEMTFEAMIRAAEDFGLSALAVTDHSDPGDDIDSFGNFLLLKERLKTVDTPVRVLVGAELSVYGIGKYAEKYEVDKALDFSSYSHIHYHLDCWDQPEDRSPAGYAAHNVRVLEELFKTGRADCIAHPFSPLKMHFFNEEQKAATLSALTDNALGDILQKGEEAQCMWELHTPTVFRFPDFSRRFFNLGREVGVHFCVGTDAHNLAALDTPALTERLREVIG